MFTFLGAWLLAGAAPALPENPKEERLIAATIAELPAVVAIWANARFRRVYLRRLTSREGAPQVYLCGQIDIYDPLGPDGWTVFASLLWGDRALVFTRQGFLVDVDTACAPSLGGWDDGHDLAGRFEAEVRARRLRN